MERDTVYELTAAYALNALDDHEEAEYEAHLQHCERCREELAALQTSAASLAYAVEGPAPPAELRDRILVQARRERPNVVPFASRRRSFRLATAAAAAAACAALGLGLWAASLSSQLEEQREAERAAEEALAAVLGDPAAIHASLDGADGSLVVTPSGEAALVIRNLEPLPEGRYYTAWVSRDGVEMEHAGAFDARAPVSVFALTEPVPDGGLVAVTVEDRPDAAAPSSDPIFASDTA